MTPDHWVQIGGPLTDAHRAAIKALHRASPERTATSCAADITMLEIAARMAAGLPVSEDAVREVGRRYVELIVELGKQVDARMSAEADAQKLIEYAQAGVYMVPAAADRLSADDVRLIDRGLGALSSDYNDVPHEAIDTLRKRLAAGVVTP